MQEIQFYGFDENGEPTSCEYTSEEVTKMYVEGWCSPADPSKGTGFSDPDTHNVSILIGKGDTVNPDEYLSRLWKV